MAEPKTKDTKAAESRTTEQIILDPPLIEPINKVRWVPCVPKTFNSLPAEVVQHICSFIKAEDLLKNFRLVSKRINNLIANDGFWKVRLRRNLQGNDYPMIDALGLNRQNRWYCGNPVSYRDLCYQMEKESMRWSRDTSVFSFSLSKPHYASVDAVKLMNDGNLCVSGGRDRTIALWDVNVRNLDNALLGQNTVAHHGWIWDVKACEKDTFYSADWDGQVVRWCIQNGLKVVTEYNVQKTALCLAVKKRELVVGLQAPYVCFLDPRIGLENNLYMVKVHKRAVMGVVKTSDYIVSVSEDTCMTVLDTRKMSILKTFKVSESKLVGISKCKNLLYVADISGIVHIIDINRDFEKLETLTTPHGRITSIWAGLGSCITSSRDAFVSIFSPTKPIVVRKDFRFETEIAMVDYEKDVLAVARSDNSLSIYKKKDFIKYDA